MTPFIFNFFLFSHFVPLWGERGERDASLHGQPFASPQAYAPGPPKPKIIHVCLAGGLQYSPPKWETVPVCWK